MLPFVLSVHYWLSRIGLGIALVMLLIAVYIGLLRHGDVTRWFRRATYGVVVFSIVESLLGLSMVLFFGLQPPQPVHYVYGIGAVLCLPFFIFVETTAKKRPAMGSYLWGFTLLLAIFVRAIMTGVPA